MLLRNKTEDLSFSLSFSLSRDDPYHGGGGGDYVPYGVPHHGGWGPPAEGQMPMAPQDTRQQRYGPWAPLGVANDMKCHLTTRFSIESV